MNFHTLLAFSNFALLTNLQPKLTEFSFYFDGGVQRTATDVFVGHYILHIVDHASF